MDQITAEPSFSAVFDRQNELLTAAVLHWALCQRDPTQKMVQIVTLHLDNIAQGLTFQELAELTEVTNAKLISRKQLVAGVNGKQGPFGTQILRKVLGIQKDHRRQDWIVLLTNREPPRDGAFQLSRTFVAALAMPGHAWPQPTAAQLDALGLSVHGLENTTTSAERRELILLRYDRDPTFRRAILAAYNGKCCLTGETTEAALEAAHIDRYADGPSNATSNGILLRADLHRLFDRGLLTFKTGSGAPSAVVAKTVSQTYRDLDGEKLRRPSDKADWPDNAALKRNAENAPSRQDE